MKSARNDASATSVDSQHPQPSVWRSINPAMARDLTDARQQFHQAVQFAASTAISYLVARPDDSHTNLGWVKQIHALASREIPSAKNFRVGITTPDLALVLVDPSGAVSSRLPLNGRIVDEGEAWLRLQLSALGADGNRLSFARHYTIPPHPVAAGAPFSSGGTKQLAEICAWFSNSAVLLEEIAASTPGASPVRCWPHHFDMATLVEGGHGSAIRTMGIGLEPGDEYYEEPYLYVNMYPAPAATTLIVPLAGGGTWHTRDWVGAVLPGSRLVENPADQEQEVRVFLKSARAACRMIGETGGPQ